MGSLSAPAWLQSIPRGTRIAAAATIVLSLSLAVARTNSNRTVPGLGAVFGASGDSTVAFPWLVVVPGSVMWFPWTLLTAAFCEASLLELIFGLASLVLSGKYLERVWGQNGFLLFVGVVVVASNVIAVGLNVLEHIVFQDSGLLLFGQSYHGMMALQAAFLVAFTQLIPEHQVQLLGGLVKLRVKQLPMLYVTFSSAMTLLGYQSPFILIQFGWLTSWFYLRFIKQNEGMDFRGDRSETFAFTAWFPPFIRPYVAQISTIVFNLAVKIGVLQAWGPSNDVESGHVNTRAEAERRRALALKALDQRLANKPATSPRGTSAMGASTSSSGGPSGTSGGGNAGSSGLGKDSNIGNGGAGSSGGEVMFEAQDEDIATTKERD